MASIPFERVRAVLLDVRGLDVVNVHARTRLQARVHQRFVQREVRIADLHVLADHGDVDLSVRIRLGADHLAPLRQIRGRCFEAELVHHDVIETLLVQQARDLVDVVRVDSGNHRTLFHVREQCDLAPLLFRQRVLAAAEKNVRLDTDSAQLLDRVLRRFRLDFAGPADTGTSVKWMYTQVLRPSSTPS